VERVAVGSYGAMVIGIGKAKLSASLPLMARIEEDVSTKSKYFATVDSKLMRLTQVRDAMAKKHGVIPAMFMNDRVLMNVVDKCPKNITELWGVDGISDEFAMTYGDEFMEGLGFLTTSNVSNFFNSFQRNPTPRKSTAKEEVLTHFREGKSIEEIANCRQVSKNTIENQILSIMETEDVDIDPDYFGLTEEYEDEIKEAIGRIGSERLSPIKECVNPSISYTQIKVCIMIIRIEGQ
jgi:ATP-dependent DNA helicase RecQ